MKNYDKYKVLKEELKAPRFENEDEEIEWFTIQLYGLYKQSYRLRKENQDLKEKIILLKAAEPMLELKKMIENDKSQKFIKYLEDEINKWHSNFDNYDFEYETEEPSSESLLNEILSKYKEIIGSDVK